MLHAMTFESYVDCLLGQAGEPLTLGLILTPFRLPGSNIEDGFLRIGVFLQCLAEEYTNSDWIDPIDIATSALALGYLPAEEFVKKAARLMIKATLRHPETE